MPERYLKTPAASAREKIVLAAFDLFHANGMYDTSVDDILKKSSTGKSQFYHYFGSKEGLIHDMLDVARKKIRDGEIIGIGVIDTWQDLRNWFDAAIEKSVYFDCARACPMGRFAAEMAENDELLRKDLQLVFETKKQFPKDFFTKLKAKGELTEDADPEGLAEFCMAVMQGSFLSAKIYKDPDPMRLSLDHAYAYLRSFAK